MSAVYFTDKFNVSSARYAFLFSFENIFGLFRLKKSAKNPESSMEYDLLSFAVHHSNYEEDALIDICLSVMAGKYDIEINDIFGLRINGKLYSYRYVKRLKTLQTIRESFVRVDDFFSKETEYYINRIHNDQMVLSVLDGCLYPVSSKDFLKNRVFCIENENFNRVKGPISSNYSMYGLYGKDIKNLNPGNFPFVSLKNAIYFFNKKKRKEKSSMLLFNRLELEMLKDHFQLSGVQFQIEKAV